MSVKRLNKYPTVRDTLEGLNNKILIKKFYIDKLVVQRTNLESLLLSLFITTLYLLLYCSFKCRTDTITKKFKNAFNT